MNKNNKYKVLVLGAEGMLGNAVFSYLKNEGIKVFGTSNTPNSKYYYLDAHNFNEVVFKKIMEKFKPKFIINCIGYIRPKDESFNELKRSIEINSIFPQKLSIACIKSKIRLIHFSTDCVFSGKKGNYKETNIPDANSNYGISKFLGEVRELPNITIRTSLIGRELNSRQNLLDWFLSVRSKEIKGYKKVFWNGITTLTAAKIVKEIIVKNIHFENSLIQISSNKINKYKLLCLFNKIFKKNFIITPVLKPKNNKILISSEIQKKYFKPIIPSIEKQIVELKDFYV